MRLLFVHPRSQMGGASESLLCSVPALEARGVECMVYCPHGAVAQAFRSLGTRVIEGQVPEFVSMVSHTWLQAWPRNLLGLIVLPFHIPHFVWSVLANDVQIVHLNEAPMVADAVLTKLLGRRLVWHVRGLLPTPEERIGRFWRRILGGLADSIVAIDEEIAAPLDGLPQLCVMYNPVIFPDPVGEVRANKVSRPIQVGMISRISFAEGFAEFVQAAVIVSRQTRNVAFRVIGGLPPRVIQLRRHWLGRLLLRLGFVEDVSMRAHELIEQSGVTSRLTIEPFNPDRWSVYRELDVVVTGGVIGTGRQVAEAAAAKLPVIALSNCKRLGTIQDRVTGFLIPPGLPEELASKVMLLASSEELRCQLGNAGYERAHRLFLVEGYVEKLLNLYAQLLSEVG